jgi:hypothetical protein
MTWKGWSILISSISKIPQRKILRARRKDANNRPFSLIDPLDFGNKAMKSCYQSIVNDVDFTRFEIDNFWIVGPLIGAERCCPTVTIGITFCMRDKKPFNQLAIGTLSRFVGHFSNERKVNRASVLVLAEDGAEQFLRDDLGTGESGTSDPYFTPNYGWY